LSDFILRSLTSAADLAACVDVQEAVWGRGFSERVGAALLRVSLRVGAVLEGAFDVSGQLLGHVWGLTGMRAGQAIHWSDMMAVRPEARDRGIGEALKRRQREVLLSRGVRLAEWTFDPLESRNAHINFARCGVVAGEYIRDFYGGSDSPLHTGLATDRLIVTWRLDSERVARRVAGSEHPPSPARLRDVAVINPVRTEAGHLLCDEARLHLPLRPLLLAVPASIQRLKEERPEIARQWRASTRAALEHYIARGYTVTEFVRGMNAAGAPAWGAYLLEVNAESASG
jgi:predicted GNAT superfamily acetyltransferase